MCINSTRLVVPLGGQDVHKPLHGLCGLTTDSSTAFVGTQGGRNPVNIHSARTYLNDGGLPIDLGSSLGFNDFPDRYVCAPCTPRPQPGTHDYTSEYTTVNHIKQATLVLRVYYHPNLTNRVGLPISSTFQTSPLAFLSSLIMGRERQNLWSSPFLRQTSVGGRP